MFIISSADGFWTISGDWSASYSRLFVAHFATADEANAVLPADSRVVELPKNLQFDGPIHLLKNSRFLDSSGEFSLRLSKGAKQFASHEAAIAFLAKKNIDPRHVLSVPA